MTTTSQPLPFVVEYLYLGATRRRLQRASSPDEAIAKSRAALQLSPSDAPAYWTPAQHGYADHTETV